LIRARFINILRFKATENLTQSAYFKMGLNDTMLAYKIQQAYKI